MWNFKYFKLIFCLNVLKFVFVFSVGSAVHTHDFTEHYGATDISRYVSINLLLCTFYCIKKMLDEKANMRIHSKCA